MPGIASTLQMTTDERECKGATRRTERTTWPTWALSVILHAGVVSVLTSLVAPTREREQAVTFRVREQAPEPPPGPPAPPPEVRREPPLRDVQLLPDLALPFEPLLPDERSEPQLRRMASTPTLQRVVAKPVVPSPSEPTERPEPAVAPASIPSPRVDAVPVADNLPPSYPSLSRARQEEGQVMLEVELDLRGHVLDVRILTSSGHPRLDAAARAAVAAWRFSPATEDGAAIACQTQVTVEFRLQ